MVNLTSGLSDKHDQRAVPPRSSLYTGVPALTAGAIRSRRCCYSGLLFWRQLGHDATNVDVVDVETGETTNLRIISILPRDAIAAINHPRFVDSAKAARWMEQDEQVIGLAIEGEEKAYPIKILSRHEIVNDTVGGKPVAVTW